MKKTQKKGWYAVFTVAILIVIGALGALCWYLYGMYTSGKEYDGLTISVPSSSSAVPEKETDDKSSRSVISEVSSTDTTDEETKRKKKNNTSKKDEDVINGNVNFSELWKINTDVYAWIKVPNTNIDYPILQTSGDDAFYLEHNMYKQYAFAGSVYTEKINKKDFSDPNTLIYGHNLLNGTMFASLHNFRDPNFFANNEYFYIYLPDRTLTYQIFSAYEYDDRHIMYSFDFNDKDEFAEYLEYATNPTNSMTYNTRDISVTTDDKIVTLSTCMDAIATSRYLVQGVLVSDEPI
ncbi:MAG: class B sortase [Clostridia bacterium]|nr:class B sortase [Clostridia bacterium]